MAKTIKRTAEAWTYVLVTDRALPIDQQTRFVLKPLTHVERATVRDSLSRLQIDAAGTKALLDRTRQEAFGLALSNIVAVENFPVGEARAWPAKKADREAFLDQLDDDDVLEIGNEIWERSKLGMDGAPIKNSSRPAPTSGSGEPSAAAAAATA